jgi:hypothetical protein
MRRPVPSVVFSPVMVMPPFTDRAFSVAFAALGISSVMRPFVASRRIGLVISLIFTET